MSSHVIEPFKALLCFLRKLTRPAMRSWPGMEVKFNIDNPSLGQSWWTLPWSSSMYLPDGARGALGKDLPSVVPMGTPVMFRFPVVPLAPKDIVQAVTTALLVYATSEYPMEFLKEAGTPDYIVEWLVAESLVTMQSSNLQITKRGRRWVRTMVATPLP